jgi:hypothetical protein
MEVETTKAYTHLLNVAIEGSAVRSTGCGRRSQTRATELAGPNGRPKTGTASCWTRQKSLQETNRCRPSPTTGPFVFG